MRTITILFAAALACCITPAAAEATKAQARDLEAQVRDADELIALAIQLADRVTLLKQSARLSRLSGDFPSLVFEAYGNCRMAAAALSGIASTFSNGVDAELFRFAVSVIDGYDETLRDCDKSIGVKYRKGPLKALRDSP